MYIEAGRSAVPCVLLWDVAATPGTLARTARYLSQEVQGIEVEKGEDEDEEGEDEDEDEDEEFFRT